MQFIPSWLQAWLLLSENKATILAALLHDVIEDTQCTEEELRDQFGSEVLKLVLGLTKIVEIREDNLIPSKSKKFNQIRSYI